MGSRSRRFFATYADSAIVFRAIEQRVDINYVSIEALEYPRPTIYRTYSTLPDLGISKLGIAGSGPMYLIVPNGTEIATWHIMQRKVGIRYYIDQDLNPASIVIHTGGLFTNEWLVCGDFGTVSDHPVSSMLYDTFAREVKRTFKFVGSFWIGPEALQRYQNGIHFTDDIRSGKEFRFENLKTGT